MQISGWRGERLYWALRATGGRETDSPATARGIYSAGAMLAWQLQSGLLSQNCHAGVMNFTFLTSIVRRIANELSQQMEQGSDDARDPFREFQP